MKYSIYFLPAALMLCAVSFAQSAPGWSRGQQLLQVSYDGCLDRASQAFTNQGYRIDYAQGSFRVGMKGVHTATINCIPASNGISVIIMVASNGDGGGLERQCLQTQMEQPGASTPCGTGNTGNNGGNRPPDLVRTTWDWTIGSSSSLGTINFFTNGEAKATWSNLPEKWWYDTNGDLMVAANGTQYVNRLKWDPKEGAFKGGRDVTSQTQDGIYSTVKPKK